MAAGLTRESLQVEVRLIETALVVKVDGTSEGLPAAEGDYQVGQAIELASTEAMSMVREGRITDAKTIMLLQWAALDGHFADHPRR